VFLVITNIKGLLISDSEKPLRKKEMSHARWLENAWLRVMFGKITGFGSMKDFVADEDDELFDASGRFVIPCWCDSHTHLVFAAWREKEFEDRINGLSYEQIAARGGGILNSVEKLRKTSSSELYDLAAARLEEMIRMGTGAVEIKSGYGLSLESELKMLRVIEMLKARFPIPVKATFLGAHAVPQEFKKDKTKYIRHLTQEMIPAIASEKLADFCDVFCERNYFTKEEAIEILECAARYGMKPKVHANQLSHSGGIEAGIHCKAISVDHLEYTSDNDLKLLAASETVATLLPGAAFFLNLPLPPARKMIDAGVAVAVATDFNPGSSPTGNMNLMISMLCVQYGLTPSEAIHAATLNGAFAMDVQKECGSIAIGKNASFIITKKMDSPAFIPYSLGSNPADKIFINGKVY
jgi:imidazolonepropionase